MAFLAVLEALPMLRAGRLRCASQFLSLQEGGKTTLHKVYQDCPAWQDLTPTAELCCLRRHDMITDCDSLDPSTPRQKAARTKLATQQQEVPPHLLYPREEAGVVLAEQQVYLAF